MSRDRDERGRPRNARPRDDLGRPLPRATGTSAPIEDPPALPPVEALATAQQLLDSGRAFAAHEVLEAVWKSAPDDERELWRGLAQLAVGVTHHGRGNPRGAAALLTRAARSLAPYAGTSPAGIAVDDLRSWAIDAAAHPTSAATMPRLRAQAADERS
jgi:hypothetical protein